MWTDQRFLFQTVLSGEVYTCMCFLMDMVNVSLELKDPKGREGAGSLARCGSHYIALFYNNSNTVTLIQVTVLAESRGSGVLFHSGMWSAECFSQVEVHRRLRPDSIGCTLVAGSRKYQGLRTGESFSSCYRGLGRLCSLQSPWLTEQTESWHASEKNKSPGESSQAVNALANLMG